MESNPVIHTTHGAIQGETRDGVAIFRGIPYGGHCDNDRRFLPALPAQDWDGVRDCTKNGFIARQYGGSISGSDGLGPYFSGGKPELFGVADEKQDENCLVLNVMTPGLDDRKRAVLVYIHGGGFTTGTGSLMLGADKFANEEDIVVVGVNHRLNIFGFLYLGAFDDKYAESGMVGMLDLVLALEWVRDNIAAFGGDPGKVTIMGESGGGMKVSTLLAMPKAKGLFHGAIVESGSSPVGTLSTDEATKVAGKVLDKLGVDPNHLNKLSDIASDDVLAASKDLGFGELGPVADGINLAYNATNTYNVPDISDVPLMVGASEDELAVFSPPSAFKVTWDTLADALCKSGTVLGESSKITKNNVDGIIAAFKAADTKGITAEHLYMNIISMASFLGGGAYYQAQASASHGKSPVYHYMVTFDAPHPLVLGAYSWHTADLPLQLRIVLHPECEALSKTMAHMWGQFIRTGNPTTDTLAWPAFTIEGKHVMVFDDVCRVEHDPMKAAREALENI